MSDIFYWERHYFIVNMSNSAHKILWTGSDMRSARNEAERLALIQPREEFHICVSRLAVKLNPGVVTKEFEVVSH